MLVEPGCPPPEPGDCLEDWVLLPASDDEVRQRARALSLRARVHGASRPVLDPDGVLRRGGLSVLLPPIDARLTALLLERSGAVVSRQELARAGWPGARPGRSSLDVQVMRLRRRLAPAGLVVRTVRSRGYLLDGVSEPVQQLVAEP